MKTKLFILMSLGMLIPVNALTGYNYACKDALECLRSITSYDGEDALTYLHSLNDEQPHACTEPWAQGKPEVQRGVAELYLETGQLGKAVDCLEEAIETGDKKAGVFLERIKMAIADALSEVKPVIEERYNINQLAEELIEVFDQDDNLCAEECKESDCADDAEQMKLLHFAKFYKSQKQLGQQLACLYLAPDVPSRKQAKIEQNALHDKITILATSFISSLFHAAKLSHEDEAEKK